MSSKETMWIAFPNGGILPATITGGKDRDVDAHEPVRVPADYGKHLVHDRFAYEATPKGKATKPSSSDSADARLRLEATLAGLRAKAEEVQDPAEKAKLAEQADAVEKKIVDLAAGA